MDITFYIWLGILVLTLICEAASAGLTSIWFSGGALVALIFELVGLPLWLQIAAFFAVSVALLIFVRPILSKTALKVEKTNIDTLPDEVGIVIETIEPVQGKGQVKVKGQIWSAKPEDDDQIIQEGTQITVVAVSGVKLVVRPR